MKSQSLVGLGPDLSGGNDQPRDRDREDDEEKDAKHGALRVALYRGVASGSKPSVSSVIYTSRTRGGLTAGGAG